MANKIMLFALWYDVTMLQQVGYKLIGAKCKAVQGLIPGTKPVTKIKN